MPLARLWQRFLKLAGTLSVDRCLDGNSSLRDIIFRWLSFMKSYITLKISTDCVTEGSAQMTDFT